jgi:hypothetical protein
MGMLSLGQWQECWQSSSNQKSSGKASRISSTKVEAACQQ